MVNANPIVVDKNGHAEYITQVQGDAIIAALGNISGGGGSGALATPQGRLTLTSGVPVLTAEVASATTVYYTPYVGNSIPIWSGSAWSNQTFTELSQATTDTTKSPAAVATSSVYDMFVWSDSGTLRCTRGPVWSSTTSRGTGAGTSQITRDTTTGLYTNTVAISNGPGAGLGTYVGTIHSDGTSTLNMNFLPAAATGGSVNRLDVWNAYNRRRQHSTNRDSTASWVYSSTTWRAKNNSAGNEIQFVVGLVEDSVEASQSMMSQNSGGANSSVGWALDSVTTPTAGAPTAAENSGTNQCCNLSSTWRLFPTIGAHFIVPLEQSEGSTNTFLNSTTGGGDTFTALWSIIVNG